MDARIISALVILLCRKVHLPCFIRSCLPYELCTSAYPTCVEVLGFHSNGTQLDPHYGGIGKDLHPTAINAYIPNSHLLSKRYAGFVQSLQQAQSIRDRKPPR